MRQRVDHLEHIRKSLPVEEVTRKNIKYVRPTNKGQLVIVGKALYNDNRMISFSTDYIK